MASKEAIKKAMERGYNVREATCDCPFHEGQETFVLAQKEGITVKRSETDYGYYCKECYTKYFDTMEGSPKAGQNIHTGLQKAKVKTGRSVQFTFNTTQYATVQKAKGNGYGATKLSPNKWALTTVKLTTLSGIAKQWKAWKLPSNLMVTWAVYDEEGTLYAMGYSNRVEAMKKARIHRETI